MVEVPSSDWDDLLAKVGAADAYLRRAYVEASALLEPGRPVLLHEAGAGGDVVFCFLLRDIPRAGGARDIITPYGYGGAVATGIAPPLEAFNVSFRAWAADNSVITAFFRFHPLYRNVSAAPAGTEVVPLAGTVGWDLAPNRDIEASMHSRHRRLVRKARNAGVEMRVERGADRLPAFRDLYETTMRRQEAADFYFFEDRYWELLAAGFGQDLVFSTALLDGEPIAALLCMRSDPWLHYHLGATGNAARSIGASNLCFLAAAQWGQAERLKVLHLGGGVGGHADSLYDFKLRYDPERGALDAALGKLVLDARRYRELSGTDDTAGFFPAYRRPVVAAPA